MGFEELPEAELVQWVGSWVGRVSGTAPFTAVGGTEYLGTVTVSVWGDLVRLALDPTASRATVDELSRAIERGYTVAFREALRQVGLVFDRLEHDVADDPHRFRRLRAMREEYGDRDGLRRLLAAQQRYQEEVSWDPVADPLRRNV